MLPNLIARQFQNFSEAGSIGKYFGSCFKSSNDIKVWPPSKQSLRQELTIAANAVLVYTAVKCSGNFEELPVFCRLQKLIAQSLDRALQFMSESPSLLISVRREHDNITSLMQKIHGALKDPIIHFRTLDVLCSIVLVCGLACLLVKQQLAGNDIQQILSVFQEITNLLSEGTLQERLPYENGYLADKMPDNGNVGNFPCVQDFVSTILCLCPSNGRAVRVVYKPWQWLDIICLCKEYMNKQAYSSAMENLEALLNTPLDPEIRSLALCLFADCYLHQDCFQLALQTCKAALKASKDYDLVYVYLAKIYKILKNEDLELETSNLLIKLLTDKCLKIKTLTPDLHLDALVFSVSGVLPTVRLPETICHFARRCAALHRYTEASEQYMTLLKLLEEDPECTSANSIQTAYSSFDVQEIIVESSEALALAKQTKQCLSLVEKFLPVLEANDSVFQSASNILNSDVRSTSLHDSQDSLLVSQLHIDYQSSSVHLDKKKENVEVMCDIGSSSHFQFENLCDSVKKKRQRSCSFSMEEYNFSEHCGSENKSKTNLKHFEDPWFPASLIVRLLLSKADVLIHDQGYTDEVMSCLCRAQDLLLNDTTSSIFHLTKNRDTQPDTSSSPSPKRRKVVSDKLQASTSQPNSLHMSNSQTVSVANEYKVLKMWRDMVVKVGERMQKAFISKKQSVSASNVSKLIQQLAPG